MVPVGGHGLARILEVSGYSGVKIGADRYSLQVTNQRGKEATRHSAKSSTPPHPKTAQTKLQQPAVLSRTDLQATKTVWENQPVLRLSEAVLRLSALQSDTLHESWRYGAP